MDKVFQYQQALSRNMDYSDELIIEMLGSLLDKKRFDHVMRVLDTAMSIADQIALSDEHKSRIKTAVLMHDFAKGMSPRELQEYAYCNRISLMNNPEPVYHAVVGAWMAEAFFGIEDRDILDAVKYHTTGSIKFLANPVGAVLFLADYLEPGREIECSHIRENLPNDIRQGLKEVVKDKIISVVQRDKVLDQESISFYHALVQ